MNEMGVKAKEHYDRFSAGAMEFKSAGLEAIGEIAKTQEQKNQEAVAGNQKP